MKSLCKTIALLALGLAPVVLGGCAKKITSGEVSAKYIEPYREWTDKIYAPIRIGDTTIPNYLNIDKYDDEDYVIEVTQKDGDKHRSRIFYLDRESYDNIQIGDHFVYDGANAAVTDDIYNR